jgi:hypothetical protein
MTTLPAPVSDRRPPDSSPLAPERPTRILLTAKTPDGERVTAETGQKIALYLSRQPGVLSADSRGSGSLELQYVATAVTLTELLRPLSGGPLHIGID